MRMMVKLYLTLTLLFSLGIAANAGQIDADVLMDSLVQNGMLTKAQAQNVLERSQLYKSQQKQEASVQDLPEWLKKTSLQGDLTLRYELSKTKSTVTPDGRHQGRLRYRLGIVSQINDKVKVGAGFASGADDSRSSFQTFGSSFSKGMVNLDSAYGELTPAPWGSIIAGKFERGHYLWTPSDMYWDTDIRPEGGALHLETPSMAGFKGFFNSGIFIIGESSTKQDDPTMYYFQPGVSYDNGHLDFKAAMNRYVFNTTKGIGANSGYTSSACSNKGLTPVGTNCSGTLALDYDSGGASVELGYKFNVMNKVKRVAVFGDYVENLTTPDDNVGWAVGGRLGDVNIDDLGDWQAIFQYTNLERDAILDILPSSDRYEGQTNVRGIKAGFDLGLMRNVKLGVTYYRDNRIIGTKIRKSSILTDLTYKF